MLGLPKAFSIWANAPLASRKLRLGDPTDARTEAMIF
jgi:hypothetical protein